MQKVVQRATANPMMSITSPGEARRIIRAGDYSGHTAGVAPDYVQGNLCILPKDMALEFAAFCQRNPKSCPLIGMGAPGDPSLPDLGDIDKPDIGDPAEIRAGELPVFWACGVTPQSVIASVKPEFCITHAPGSMLITDLRNTKLAAL